VNAWQRYWIDDGGRHALAMVRIAVAMSILMVLRELSDVPVLVAPAAVYRPVGLWMLLGSAPPPDWLVTALWAIAGASTVAMLLGFQARTSTAVSFVSSLALASISFSSTPTWSHGYNVVFLAQLALLGGRVGDAFSVDAFLRRAVPINVARGYQWSLRLVQIAVGLMFASACFHKLRAGGFTLAWATSDNLRHHLLARYDLAGLERPAIADWILAEAWRYKAAAIGNLISQASPLVAIVFVRRPWVRAAVAVLFLVEGIAIDQLLGLPNWHWLPLAAVFVDWDYFLRKRQPPARAWQPPKRVHVFIIGFLLYDLVLSTVPKLDHRLNTYPFTAFQMFATVRAAKPWSEHRPYIMYGDTYVADPVLDPAMQKYVDHEYRFMYQTTDPAKLAPRLAVIRDELHAKTLRHELVMFVAPAYPAPAHFEKRPIAITAELTPDGIRTLLGATTTTTTIVLRPQRVVATRVQLYAFLEQNVEPRALAATRDGNSFTLAQPLPATTEHVVAETDGARWLVWSRRARK
jgi:hypothetical protein